MSKQMSIEKLLTLIKKRNNSIRLNLRNEDVLLHGCYNKTISHVINKYHGLNSCEMETCVE